MAAPEVDMEFGARSPHCRQFRRLFGWFKYRNRLGQELL